MLGGDFPFDEGAGYVFLRAAAGDVTGRIEAFNGRLPMGIDPVAAGRMAADDVGFGPFDFDVLLTREFPRFQPFLGLARRHVEVGF